MKCGTAWLVFEIDNLYGGEKLLSVLSSRRSYSAVGEYIEQIYVDRRARFEEKIQYKNNRQNWPYLWEIRDRFRGTVYCGRDPMLVARQCTSIEVIDGIVHYRYVFASFRPGEHKPYLSERDGKIEIR